MICTFSSSTVPLKQVQPEAANSTLPSSLKNNLAAGGENYQTKGVMIVLL